MKHYHRIILLFVALLFTFPALSHAQTAPSRQDMDRAPQALNGRYVLPAWETRWERRLRRQKEDQAIWLDSFRQSHPELYGVTQPPLQPVRHYAEYDPVDAIYFSWEAGTFDSFFSEMTHELLTGTDVAIYILHHGAVERSNIEAAISARGDDPADATFIDMGTLGPYYEWQTEWPYDRSLESFWTIDYGPYFVLDGAGTLGIMDPRYYWYRVNDDAVPAKLGAHLGLTVWRPDLDWEGGNLFSDGAGTCFTTHVHIAENLPQDREAVEQQLFEYFGCEKVLWLWPLHGEETSHIDMFFKNASETVLLLGEYDAAVDPVNAARLDWNATLLADETNAAGAPFEVRRFPMPDHADGVWRSYANGIVVNDLVLLPTYAQDRTHEDDALEVFADAFPGRTVVNIDSDDIIAWGGAIHCVTRTRPAASHATIEASVIPTCGGAAACATGCGDLTYSGDCVEGFPVYCEDGEVVVEICLAHERCGWDAQGRYTFCVTAGCGDLPPEGECLTDADGDTVAVWCEDGFPLADRCPADAQCAHDPDVQRVACDDTCTQACGPGESGCDANGDAWTCGEAGDGDDCRERLTTPCPAGSTCAGGACQCEDECVAGESGCDINGDAWTCGEAGDGDDCLEVIRDRCSSSAPCSDGVCRKKGCGCESGSQGGGGAAGLLLLAFLLLRITRRTPHV